MLTKTCDIQIGTNSYMVVEIDHSIIKTLDPDDVFIVDHRKLCQDYPVRYFKNMQKDTDIMMCPSCQQFFDTEEFDLLFNKTKACPFCSSKNIG